MTTNEEQKPNPGEKQKTEKLALTIREKKLLAIVALVVLLFGGIGGFAGINIYNEFGGSGLKTVFTGNKNIKVEENSAIIDAVNKTGPAVVSITSEQSTLGFFGQTSNSKSSGTGFIISSDGLIVTNKHVVSDYEATYSVFTSDGDEHRATVKAKDPLNDIAFLTIDGKNLPTAELGDSDQLKVGQTAIAIGNALGQYQNTVTSGVISAIGRAVPVGDASGASSETLENVIQTDAAINPGNSGGPLINLDGQVIGINTAIDSSGQSIGFAIPINAVKTAIDSVKKTGKVTRPYIGLRYIPVTKEFAARNDIGVASGILVYGGGTTSGVVAGSPADKAGIKENDVILDINGIGVNGNQTLAGALLKYSPGETVTLKIFRDGKNISVKVKLGETK
ncbi:hypothetical protein COY62_02515 [bacterium (Candidatus Howlettbacteria) CG_4_10_14_0_8_um_filter_40_9]|nr:MAG: hypothetical protein COY62_02515 [bacterium (Candidatus Howlettbacteria) CG_4_10_14_0_8_um_filter_40_9]